MGQLPDSAGPRSIVTTLLDALPPGSYLALSDGTDTSPALNQAIAAYNQNSASSYHLRSPEEIARFFDGLTLVPPGVVDHLPVAARPGRRQRGAPGGRRDLRRGTQGLTRKDQWKETDDACHSRDRRRGRRGRGPRSAGGGTDRTEEFGAVQVVNHGVPLDLVADLNARAGRLLGLPRAEKAKLASRTPTGAGGSGRTTSGGSSSSASTWPSSTTSMRPGRPAWPRNTWACSRTPTCGRPTTRGCGTWRWRTSRRPAAWRSGCWAVRRGAGAARGLVRPRYPPHLRLTVNDYPTWTYPETAFGRGQAAAARARGRLGGYRAGPARRLRGAAGPGPGGEWIPVPVIPGALQVFSGHLLARWTGGRLRPGRTGWWRAAP